MDKITTLNPTDADPGIYSVHTRSGTRYEIDLCVGGQQGHCGSTSGQSSATGCPVRRRQHGNNLAAWQRLGGPCPAGAVLDDAEHHQTRLTAESSALSGQFPVRQRDAGRTVAVSCWRNGCGPLAGRGLGGGGSGRLSLPGTSVRARYAASMSSPTLNEIRESLAKFALEWKGSTYERGQAQGFWREFFACFGISGQSAVLYEHQVKKLGGAQGFIDSFIPGKLIVEAKSKGKNLDAAFSQAEEYALALAEAERPRWVIVSDFDIFRLTDLSKDTTVEIELKEIAKKAHLFRFLITDVDEIVEEREIDRSAAYKVSRLHTALLDGGLTGSSLDVFLTRLLFCFFADDTGLFGENGAFHRLVRKVPDSQLGGTLGTLFQTLDKRPGERQHALDEDLARFPYVNGSLFRERLDMPIFDGAGATLLRECSALDWSDISPAIFGAMFQGILEGEYRGDAEVKRQATRRETGSHYTSERNVLKVLRGLFLDELRMELDAGRTDRDRLRKLYDHLPNLTFLDPAAGCGSFLVIAYRELRRLEMDIVDVLLEGKDRTQIDTSQMLRVTVKQFHGIELGESPAEIAKVALWITDHQTSMEAAARFGSARRSLPLVVSPTIKIGNALRIAWETVIPATHCDYVISNPPWIGAKYQSAEQRSDMEFVLGKGRHELMRGSGTLDYVAGWYVKAAEYIQGSVQSKIELDLWAQDPSAWGSKDNDAFLDIDSGWQNWRPTRVGLVATSSICQGEQVGPLWGWMLDQGMHIQFAHRAFSWANEGKGNAAVHCVITGFGQERVENPDLFTYPSLKGEPVLLPFVENINPYLVDGPDVVVTSRNSPLSDVPEMQIGNKPVDGGNYLFTRAQRDSFIAEEPGAESLFRKWMGGQELLNGDERWVLWVRDLAPEVLAVLPLTRARIDAVRDFRLRSKSAPTNKIAKTPRRFHVEFLATSQYLAVPKVSSERREFIPIAFLDASVVPSDLLQVIPNATLSHFGVMMSSMHNAWMRTVAGRLESRYRYSAGIVYNNYPWPGLGTGGEAVEAAAQAVLDSRADFPNATLAQLYDPDLMPESLAKAQVDLDRAVDAQYGYSGAKTDLERVEFLMALYGELFAKAHKDNYSKTASR